MANDIITLAHGGGGAAMQKLIQEEFLAPLNGGNIGDLQDAALLRLNGLGQAGALAMTTDSFVVQPLFFPGGDIGKLAVCGTVNDLAMRGARPLFLSVGMILEEGLPRETLRRVVQSMAACLAEVGVRVVTGDTKVVQRGKGDGIFINTTGVGVPVMSPGPSLTGARSGDRILINGTIGDHGVAVLAAREELGFSGPLQSDCAPLWGLVEVMLEAGGRDLHVLHDPTRGGLAAALHEIATQSQVGLEIHEPDLPLNAGVRGACELLGLDPLHVANEGKLVACVQAQAAETMLAAMRSHPLGIDSAIIGEVIATDRARVTMQTAIGTRRIIDLPSGELLPRIC